MGTLSVERFTAARTRDFAAVHSEANDAGWCHCVAWWVPTWDGWGERTAAENRRMREELCARGEYDGLLAYVDGTPAGWCQLGPRDRLRKLVTQLELDPDPSVWAVTCFVVAPAHRRRGVAGALLAHAVDVAREAGATRLEGYPRVSADEPGEMWTGPRGLFDAAGFTLVRDGSPRAVMSLDLRR